MRLTGSTTRRFLPNLPVCTDLVRTTISSLVIYPDYQFRYPHDRRENVCGLALLVRASFRRADIRNHCSSHNSSSLSLTSPSAPTLKRSAGWLCAHRRTGTRYARAVHQGEPRMNGSWVWILLPFLCAGWPRQCDELESGAHQQKRHRVPPTNDAETLKA